jgi:glycosyltransferase involved in cell wall biosynthesis
MTTAPAATFLMPTYNGLPFLHLAIESVLAQTFSGWRLLVVDDGSSDGSAEAAAEYGDPRVRVLRSERNQGQTAALNRGLREVETEWVARLDQDDVACPERLEQQLAYGADRPGTVLVGSWVDYVDETGAVVGRFRPPTAPREVRRELYRRPNPILHSAAMFRLGAARNAGCYPADFSYSQDFALWVALASHGEVANVGEVLTQVRQHAQKTSLNPRIAILQMTEGQAVIERIDDAFGLAGPERRQWEAGRLRIITQRAIAAAHAREWQVARRDVWEVALGAARNPLVAADLVALVGESLAFRTGLARRRAARR